jgi:hypothetical protein
MKKAILLGFIHFAVLQFTHAQEIFDMPNATGTYLNGINDSGEICGYYTTATATFAFMINKYGDTIKLTGPGGSNAYVDATGISNNGMVVGNYGASAATAQSYIYLPSGVRFTAGQYFAVPAWGGTNTTATGITNDTCIAGSYDVGPDKDGALWCKSAGTETALRCLNQSTVIPTFGCDLDNNHNVCGFLIEGAMEQCFIYRNATSSWDTFQIGGFLKSRALGMNDNGWICGNYSSQTKGFYCKKLPGQNYSNFSQIIVKGASTIYPTHINNNNDIVGFYTDASGVDHGFINAHYDIGFRPSKHGWGFNNSSADAWPPAYYNQFNYAHDPYINDGTTWWPLKMPGSTVYVSSTHDAWPDMVKILKLSQCYLDSAGTGHKVHTQAAYNKWVANIKPQFQGSCFGMVNTAMEIYDNPNWYFNHFPDAARWRNTPTPNIPTSDSVLTTAHQTQCYCVYTTEEVGYEQAQQTANTTITPTLQAIMRNLRNSRTRPHRSIGIPIPNGGHAIVPYALAPGAQGNGVDTIYVYDPNYHGVDSLYLWTDATGGWHYTANGRHADYGTLTPLPFMGLPDSTFQRQLTLGAGPPTNPFWRSLGNQSPYFNCYFNDSSIVQMTDDSGHVARVAYDTSYSSPLIFINYRLSGLSGLRPAGTYCHGNTVLMSKNTLAGYADDYLAVSGDSYFLRCNRTPGSDTTDNYSYDATDITYLDNQTHNDTINYTLNLDDSTGEHNYYITNITVAQGNKLTAGIYGTEGMVIENFGPPTTYVITTDFITNTVRTFMDTITISGNTRHIIQPHDTTYSGIYIMVDTGMTGVIEDSIFIHQTITDVNRVNAPNITAWPVPTGDELFMSGPQGLVKYTIVDVTGRIVSAGQLDFGNGITQKFDLRNYAPGVYTIAGNGPQGKWTYVFVKD